MGEAAIHAKAEWVERVLGARLGSGASDAASEDGSEADAPWLSRLDKARVGLVEAQRQAVADLQRLAATLGKLFAEDESQQAELSAAQRRLDTLAARLRSPLPAALNAVLAAPDAGARGPLVDQARGALIELRTAVESDPVMAELDGNAAQPDIRSSGLLRQRLADVATALS